MLLQGLFVPLTCPFYRDGASYLRKLEGNVARYSLSPASGLIALPPGGEADGLTDAEAHSLLQAVGETAGKAKVLLAGVERSSVSAALDFITVAEKAHFDAILLAPPPDWSRLVHGEDARELVVFYESVADRSPLPIVLWSDQRPPAFELPVELIASLAKHPNVIGLLDASLTEDRLSQVQSKTQDIQREVTVTTIFESVTRRMLQPVQETAAASGFVSAEALGTGTAVASAATAIISTMPPIKTRTKTVGFQVLTAAAAHDMVALLAAGASGGSPTVAACAPQACYEAYAAWKDGDTPLAIERGERLRAMGQLSERLGPAAVKAACDFNGYYGGQPRLPRLPLTAEDRTAVEQALTFTRN